MLHPNAGPIYGKLSFAAVDEMPLPYAKELSAMRRQDLPGRHQSLTLWT